MKNNQDKRKERKRFTAEDFTPSWLVNQMLDKLNEYGKESWEDGKTFLDPACGNGNILVCVLKRKLQLNHNPLKAIQSIYGADIMDDNIKECRLRLLKVLDNANIKITKEHIRAVLTNIICCPLNKYKNGSLDYDFEFNKKISDTMLEKNLNQINEGKLKEIYEPFEDEKENPFKEDIKTNKTNKTNKTKLLSMTNAELDELNEFFNNV